MNMRLPEGFTLDQKEEGIKLPDGFSLDSGKDESEGFDGMVQGVARGIRSFTKPIGNSLQKLGEAASPYDKSQVGSPQDLLSRAAGYIQQGADRAGEFTSETLAKGGVDPNVAAGAGTFVQMAPDIVSQASIPNLTKGVKPNRILRGLANDQARRHLGLRKRFLGTPFARGQATRAADVALDQKLIPLSGNPEKTFSRVSLLKDTAGQRIGEVGSRTPVKVSRVIDDLDGLGKSMTMGTNKGVFKGINTAINEVKQTLVELSKSTGKTSAEALMKIRKRLADSINFLADNASQIDSKAIQGQLGTTIRNAVKAVQSPEVYGKFINDQRSFSAYKTMLKGLNDEIAGQLGNNLISIPSMGVAAGQLATGRPGAAVASTGLFEGIRRRGAGTAARILKGSADVSVGAKRSIPQILPKVSPDLTEDEAMRYLRSAGGDADLARRMAIEDGKQIPE